MSDECRLIDDGTVVIAVEAGPDPQSLCIRAGPVFYPEGVSPDPGVWIEYQEHHMKSLPAGPVLLTPAVWRQLAAAVEEQLAGWE